ncbi:MAG: hypothetical protein OXI20_21105 [Rhodospirillales bacterium]|nr:hypothetical protein [Rhodospirillales bacterium]
MVHLGLELDQNEEVGPVILAAVAQTHAPDQVAEVTVQGLVDALGGHRLQGLRVEGPEPLRPVVDRAFEEAEQVLDGNPMGEDGFVDFV